MIPNFKVQQARKRLRFDATSACQFAYGKQFLLPNRKGNDIESVASRLVGVHAARLITPFFALRSRLPGLAHSDVHAAAFGNRCLIKARCMRGTLHLLPMPEFKVAHRATLGPRLRVCQSIYNKLNLGQRQIGRLARRILQSVEPQPLSSRQIEAAVLRIHPRTSNEAVRAVLKGLWERGQLCYLNDNDEFGREQRLYGATRQTYPSLAEDCRLSTETAVRSLLHRYLRGYGPATVADIVWWSGLAKRQIEEALASLSEEVCPISLRGRDETFWLLSDELGELRRFRPVTNDWVVFLAHEDPSLKGYYSTRTRYVDHEHYDRLFNLIGESRPAVLLNGRVVGVWALDRRTAKVTTDIFARPTRRQLRLIERERHDLSSELPNLLGIN